MKNLRLAIFATSMIFSTPTSIFAQEYEYVATDKTYSHIIRIEDDGAIILNNELKIRLWGLDIVDVHRMRDLLQGQAVRCLLIGRHDEDYISDCDLYPKDDNGAKENFDIDLFVWLQEFEIASPRCSAAEEKFSGRRHAFGSEYQCEAGSTPQRYPLSVTIE